MRGTVPVPRVIKDMVGRVENNTQKVNIITYDMLIKRSRLESPGGETLRSTDMTICRFKKGEGTKTWAQNLRPIEAIGHKIKSYTPKVQPPLFMGSLKLNQGIFKDGKESRDPGWEIQPPLFLGQVLSSSGIIISPT